MGAVNARYPALYVMGIPNVRRKMVPFGIVVSQTNIALSGIYSGNSCLGVGANATCLY